MPKVGRRTPPGHAPAMQPKASGPRSGVIPLLTAGRLVKNPRMRFPWLSLVLVGLLAWSACRKRSTPAPAESPTNSAPAPPAATAPAAPGSSAAAFAPEIAAAAMKPFEKDLDSKSPNDHLRVLNEALTFWMASGRPFPKDLNELVTGKLLKRLPAPPPGKQFVLDRAKSQVVLAP